VFAVVTQRGSTPPPAPAAGLRPKGVLIVARSLAWPMVKSPL